MALSTLSAFLTGKALAVATSAALAGGGIAVATTVTTDSDQAIDGREGGENAADNQNADSQDIVERARAEARTDIDLPDNLDELVPVVETERGTGAEDASGQGRSSAVHEALTGDGAVTPADGAEFGAAVADQARDGAGVGNSVAEAARGDHGAQDTPGAAESTPPADAASDTGQERAAEASGKDAGRDVAEDAVESDVPPTLPDAGADRAPGTPPTD